MKTKQGLIDKTFWAKIAQNARLLSWRSADSGQTHRVQTCVNLAF
jgi:hypothetical protein